MKKKPIVKPKALAAKSKKTKMVKPTSGKMLEMKKPAKQKSAPIHDPAFAQAVQNYESGLRFLQERKFDKSKALFQKIISGGPKELADRATVHLAACNQQLARNSVTLQNRRGAL